MLAWKDKELIPLREKEEEDYEPEEDGKLAYLLRIDGVR